MVGLCQKEKVLTDKLMAASKPDVFDVSQRSKSISNLKRQGSSDTLQSLATSSHWLGYCRNG